MKIPKSLTRPELDALLAVARKHSEADYLMILVTFNHGLRVSETLRLTSQNFVDGYIVVQRLKKSRKTTQPLLPNEVDGLRALGKPGECLFPIHRSTFWRRMQEYGDEAGIPSFKRHCHVLKHTCGRLGFKGGMTIPEVQVYLGHVDGGNTLVYMQADEAEAASAFAAAAAR